MTSRIYMDNHATTPVDPRVLAAMLPYFTDHFGNAASNHAWGWEALAGVEAARESVAKLLKAQAKDVIFTSGATESNNLAIKGIVGEGGGKHVITVLTEHKAVLDVVAKLEKRGVEVTRLAVDRGGLISPDAVAAAIKDSTVLISVMLANNEIGTIQPIAEIGRIARARGVAFHTDAAQAAGKIPIDVHALNVDLLSISAHKLYGPKGVGALYVRRGEPQLRLESQMEGGGHERGLRSGTLAVPLIVGLGKACDAAREEMDEEATRLLKLRIRLYEKITAQLDQVVLNGDWERRLPGNLNLSFAHVEGQALMMGLKDIAVSSSSACSSRAVTPSHVLRALGLTDDAAHTALRFGVGRFNTEEEVDAVAARVVATVKRLRPLSPGWRPDAPSA